MHALRLLAIGCAVALLSVPVATAQDRFPSKPIRIIVPTGIGTANDVVLELISQHFAQITGQRFVLENRAGASGTIAADVAGLAPPDGHTLLMAIPTIMSINPHVFKKPRYDATTFVPVTQLLTTNYYFTVRGSFPAKTVQEFIAYAKANPGKVSFGSAGNGSTAHLIMALLAQSASVEFLHVPYRGTFQALTDMVADQVDSGVNGMTQIRDHVRTGKVRVLAVANAERSPVMPDIPTLVEIGYPKVITTLWMGLVAPPNTPKPIVEKIHAVIAEVLKIRNVRERLQAMDQDMVGSTPAEFAEFLRLDRERWGAAVKASGFTIDD